MIYDDIFLEHETPKWHPECKERLIAIIDALKSSEIWDKLVHIKPIKAEYKDIEAVHTHEYVERIKKMKPGYADPDTYISEKSLEAALYAAGAVIEAVNKCKDGEIERAFCAVRPPGHHAEANRAMGFCIFNNIAVGARYAQKIGYKKIFIIDSDVHHGNGTQHTFEEYDNAFICTHQLHTIPHRMNQKAKKGDGFTYNIPMSSGSGDKQYSSAYNETLPPLVKKFAPDMVMVSAGYDIHARDPLSGIKVSDEGIKSIVKGILSCSELRALNSGLPFIFALEGGYNLQALGNSVLLTVIEMLG